MKRIPLSQGLFAMVDDEDYDLLSRFRWTASYNPSCDLYRATRWCNTQRRTLQMTHDIMRPAAGQYVDHVNHDTLNNQRNNLRLCSPGQNQFNTKLDRRSSTGYKGVSVFRDKWRATIHLNRKPCHLGLFESPEDAAHAYDVAARILFGDFACPNFPGEPPRKSDIERKVKNWTNGLTSIPADALIRVTREAFGTGSVRVLRRAGAK